MRRIGLLVNTIQEYAWGSFTAIPELTGKPSPSETPQAELWMGAHPKASSMVNMDGKWVSLISALENDPVEILGKSVAKRFGNRLPYLFKVLAAAQPLSIQAHPNLSQAKEGYGRENKLEIPIDASNRNYKDDMHKPECICALTPFWALNGFRSIREILSGMKKICPNGLEQELEEFQHQPDSAGLKRFFKTLLTMDSVRKQQIIEEIRQNARRWMEDDPVFKWVTTLYQDYPSDIGILSPVILNLICLAPGQAMFLQAGELHAYLDGLGIELMANSDNVLRGGLTPKHVDVPELLTVLNFEEREIEILLPMEKKAGERIYGSPAEEFVLSVISLKQGMIYKSPGERSVEILLCTAGSGTIFEPGGDDAVPLNKGTSVIIPAAVKGYQIEGGVTLYKAAVPI